MSRPLIVIPARMGSTRFPGKPLANISGVSMLRRTANVARQVVSADYVVATDHVEIVSHCKAFDLPVILTREDLKSGSDRALAALDGLKSDAKIIVNLQGDAPFTDPGHIVAVIEKLSSSNADIATPFVKLDWPALDGLREAKTTTPFSGTTLIEVDGYAVWFSKNILPAIRNEQELRDVGPLSPVCRHIGLYAYRVEALRCYAGLAPSPYETFEGLEQLRALENGMTIAAVEVPSPKIASPGIDTPEDLARAEALILEFGDTFEKPA